MLLPRPSSSFPRSFTFHSELEIFVGLTTTPHKKESRKKNGRGENEKSILGKMGICSARLVCVITSAPSVRRIE